MTFTNQKDVRESGRNWKKTKQIYFLHTPLTAIRNPQIHTHASPGLLLALVLLMLAGGVGRIFAGVYVFKDTFLLIIGLEREVKEAEKEKSNKVIQ